MSGTPAFERKVAAFREKGQRQKLHLPKSVWLTCKTPKHGTKNLETKSVCTPALTMNLPLKCGETGREWRQIPPQSGRLTIFRCIQSIKRRAADFAHNLWLQRSFASVAAQETERVTL